MDESRFRVHFGGPDQPVQALRDLLVARISATPPGGTIDWATYYFRDRLLAAELAAARERGVQVGLVVEGRPRTGKANDAVITYLTDPAVLGAGMRVIRMPRTRLPLRCLRLAPKRPRLHEKIYCFSHPVPTALVGSFNPSGDIEEEDPETIEEIGDHHIGHNLLVEIRDPALVQCLAGHVRSLNREGPWLPRRGDERSGRDHDFGDTQLHFWPRSGAHPVERLLERYGAGSRVRIAASHITSSQTVSCLKRLVKRGAQLEIVAEHTERRVPGKVERKLIDAGAAFTRLGAKANVPMHLKFVLAENRSGRHAVFGSFNWTPQSYWLNHEVAVITRDESLFEVLDQRWGYLGSLTA
jgi:phosphatidylserine/phosphatidylglycerophosphate/cardiolipin synthase-like enzyme